ncbi:unnamed protein product [Dicrocoelium dendriticum]|nr:unnamed protein product [Dicrocoelium dendriticum]
MQPLISNYFTHEPEIYMLEVVGQDYQKAMTKISKQTASRHTAESSLSELLHADSDNVNILIGSYENHPVANSENNPEETVYCEDSKNVGPSLSLQGQTVRWIDDVDRENCNPVEVIVAFETTDPRMQTKHLDLHNNGTTLIYYEWTRVPEVDSFHIDHSELRRFYFDFRPKVIKPGEKLRIPITFRSTREGIFKESWRLQSQPILNAASPVQVRLHGISVWAEHYQFVSLRKMSPITEIEKEAAYRIAYNILNHLVSQLRHPEPTVKPIDFSKTEECAFRKQNPEMHYHHNIIRKLTNMYSELRAYLREQTDDLTSFDAMFHEQWDFCLPTLRKLVYMAESVRGSSFTPNKRTDVAKLFEHVDTLSFLQVQARPSHRTHKYQICYHHLINTVLLCFEECSLLRNLHGLPAVLLSTKLKGKGSASSTSSTMSQARTSEINIKSAEKVEEDTSANLLGESEQSPDAVENLKITPNPDAWRSKVTGLIYRQLACMFDNMTACFTGAEMLETMG